MEEKKELNHLIAVIEGYEIKTDSKNFTVATRGESEPSGDRKNTKSISYHASLHGALQNLSSRLLKEKLVKGSKKLPYDLTGLLDEVQKHNAWFKEQTNGL